MNRLIIIGNGFDLAHGMKTSFKDFIADYLNNAIDIFYNKQHYKDKILEISCRYHRSYIPEHHISNGDIFETFESIRKDPDIRVSTQQILYNSIEKIKSFNWVDLEMEFFTLLADNKMKNSSSFYDDGIIDINEDFSFLRQKLLDYLSKEHVNNSGKHFSENLETYFASNLKTRGGGHYDPRVSKNTKYAPNILFLNFNYTNTLDGYLRRCQTITHTDINYIHGCLWNFDEQPIFGFGDEFDKKFLEFEDANNNDLFKHIKSFQYLETDNYNKLISFLDSEDFEVHIYGHSCGLTDRTLLHRIFENDRCKEIQIFYHKQNDTSDDFTEKTYEISRHFKDKGKFRERVVPKSLSFPMPQPIQEAKQKEEATNPN
ncbi:AbiH family protein [Carboxylicivirga marina]|uniref:Bacteriophage abortive infection AbiH n=1 Tax=Carboxylicivirga marina TaxID=2800988 RepID=A0ABS1HGW6_9BACT|nr:AbiH family protein [Carboxylicivirga marina]MBK3516720.1 hypothetical protein [Carboxylicivirga marina]